MKRQRNEESLEEVQRKNRRLIAITAFIISLAWPLLAVIKLFAPGAIDSWKEVVWAPLPFLALAAIGLVVTESAYRVHLWINREDLQKKKPPKSSG